MPKAIYFIAVVTIVALQSCFAKKNNVENTEIGKRSYYTFF